MSWQLQVLGAASLSGADKTLHPERKTMGVLSYLALEGATSRSKLAGLLWAESDERTARNNLVQVIRRLKKATDTNLVLGDDLLSLSGEVKTDAAELKILAFASDEKLLSFTGELLGPHDYDDCPDFADWLFSERERILDLRQNTLKNLIGQHQKASNYQEALHCAEALLQLDAISEEAHRFVMRLHFLAGDRAAALRAFEKCKAVLDKELSVEPSTNTHQLAAEIEFGSLLPVASKAKAELPLRVLRPPLIGREKMLADMEAAWDKSLALILRGEPGAGKSRLMRDFLDAKGAYTLFEGRPGDSNVSYSTQSRILRQVLSLYEIPLEPWQRKELSRLLPELGETPEPLTSETDQLRFYEAQASVFQSAFETGMRVIAVDDLQFFDEASFKSLYFILAKHWGKPNALQMVLSFRRGELYSESETSLKDVVQAGSACLLEVTLLSDSQVQELVGSLGIADIEPLQKTLHSYTGGNPLFMIETIKSLLESDPTDRTFKLPSSSKVQTLLQQRLEKLSQSALRLAWTAAVAQTDFSLELASHITQQSVFDLAEPLAELEQRSIFTGQRFSHDLIFEAALASISAPVKTYLHRQMAEFLEKQGANPARIAHHFIDANDQDKALPFLEQAAEFAKRDFQMIDAASFYERIAEILEAQGKKDEAFEYLNKAREHFVKSNLYETHERIIEAMFRLAHTNDQRAKSYHARADYFTNQKNDLDTAESSAREGLKYTTTPEIRATLLVDLGTAFWRQDRLLEAVEPMREAVKIEQELNSDNLGPSLANLSIVLQHLGQYQETLALQKQSIALVRQKALDNGLPTALGNYAITLAELGHIRQSLEPLQEALDLQRKIQGVELGLALTLTTLGQAFRDLCQFKTSLEALHESLAICEQTKDPLTSYFAANLANVYLLLGQNNIAKELLDKSLNELPDFHTVRAATFREQARWLIVQGDHEQALNFLEAAKKQYAGGKRKLSLSILDLLEAPLLPAKESLQIAKQVLENTKEGELKGGLALGALMRCAQATLKLKQNKEALAFTQEAIGMLQTYDPDSVYLGEIFLTHYQALSACKDKTAKAYLGQTLEWLIDIADNHVPSEYRESFLNNNPVNKAILEAARLEGLLDSKTSV